MKISYESDEMIWEAETTTDFKHLTLMANRLGCKADITNPNKWVAKINFSGHRPKIYADILLPNWNFGDNSGDSFNPNGNSGRN